jgi:hypothetical protein
MKRATSLDSVLGAILVILVLMVVTASVSAAQEREYCWRDSYGRGVGTVPTSCAPGQEMVGLFCYNKCSANMQRAGVDCHSVCPSGFRDDGLFCRRAEYGRGAGYPWWWSDGFSNSGMISRCTKDNPQLGCEMSGAIAYPKCRAGYHAVGCCICRPDSAPDCAQLGLNPGIDLSCAKKIEISEPRLGVCPGATSGAAGSGQQMDAGLCYGSCEGGYKGVGPVCWGEAPKKPVVDPDWGECGMGAAKDTPTCVKVTADQVLSVGKLAVTLATLGSSSLGNAGASAATNTGKLAELKAKYDELMAAHDNLKRTGSAATKAAIQTAETTYQVGTELNKAKNDINAITNAAKTAQNQSALAADYIRAAAQIAAILDSSGVSSTIAAYSYPLCGSFSPAAPANTTDLSPASSSTPAAQ